MVDTNTPGQRMRGLWLGLLLSIVVPAGCDGEVPQLLTVDLFASQTPGNDPFEGVQLLAFRIKADGQADVLSGAPFSQDGVREAALPSIPYSDDMTPRQIVVEGWSANEAGEYTRLLSVGRTPWLVVRETDEPRTVRVQMAKINTFVPLINSLDGNAQALTQGRVGHSVTVTAGGEVVIAGGGIPDETGLPWWSQSGLASYLSSVESINGDTQAASPYMIAKATGVEQAGLLIPRAWHSATALPTGHIFLAGGWDSLETPSFCPDASADPIYAGCTVEWYEPGKAFAVLKEPLAKARAGHTATLVDGNPDRFTILFVGGDQDGTGTYELWSPHTGSSGAIPLPDNTPRRFHTAVRAPILDEAKLEIDSVVIFGGESDDAPLASGLFFIIQNESMVVQPSALPGGARTQLTSTYVSDQGLIYLIGGYGDTDHATALNSIDKYNVRSDNWQQPFVSVTQQTNGVLEELALVTARGGHSTSLVGDSMLVVLGGSDGASPSNRAEIIYDYGQQGGGLPAPEVFSSWFAECMGQRCTLPEMTSSMNGHRAVTLDQGNVLMVGGLSEEVPTSSTLITALQLFVPQ